MSVRDTGPQKPHGRYAFSWLIIVVLMVRAAQSLSRPPRSGKSTEAATRERMGAEIHTVLRRRLHNIRSTSARRTMRSTASSAAPLLADHVQRTTARTALQKNSRRRGWSWNLRAGNAPVLVGSEGRKVGRKRRGRYSQKTRSNRLLILCNLEWRRGWDSTHRTL